MIRDHMKDADYFEGFLDFHDARIEKFENVAATLIEERGAEDKGVHSLFIALNVFYFSKLIAMYSAGRPLDEVKDFLPDVVNSMERSKDPLVHESYDYYVETIWLSSIGIMLEVDQGLWSRIEQLLSIYHDQDALAEFLLNRNMKSRKTKFFINRPYSKLYGVITSTHQDVKKLADYLRHHWYPAHDIAGWHDTHGIDDFVYHGYWSFESGAIVKILGLDDNSLKDVPYYPYDMVHYKG
ncbi:MULTISPECIES: PoNe immunity protein domain-containing protein [Bhargavaea]|uniref:PoNe immunity protein domain-containing protein n=1 Tax=Bhargavaea changchunensis TaxID=2134037 RepID=A0ABW2NAA7_9BACL|nr:PoNe immunity protein domain-containing protein [Bhargavaea sp. CC-171006]